MTRLSLGLGLVAAILIGCGDYPSPPSSGDHAWGKGEAPSADNIAGPELATSIRCLPEDDQAEVGAFAYLDIIRGDQTAWQHGASYTAAVVERDPGKWEQLFGDGYDTELTQCTLTGEDRFRFETKEYTFDVPLPGRDEITESSCEELLSSEPSSVIAINRYRRYTAHGGTLLRRGDAVPVGLFCYVSVHAETCRRSAD